MLRKILMVGIAVFFSDIRLQSLMATLLVVLVLCVHALACPYINEALDGLELLSLFGSFCTYFFGQFLFQPDEVVSPLGKSLVSFVIVVVNLCVVLAVGFMVAGRGATMVSAFGRKFRALICCEKGSEPEDDQDDKDKDTDKGEEEETGSYDVDVDVKTPKGKKGKKEQDSPVVVPQSLLDPSVKLEKAQSAEEQQDNVVSSVYQQNSPQNNQFAYVPKSQGN